jgi:hypothetical protein
MPKLTDIELTESIAAGEIGAITLDTSVFDRYGDELRHRILLGLRQFIGTKVRVVFSDIVASEVKGHLAGHAEETVAAVRKELRNHRQAWCRDESVEDLGASAYLNDEPIDLAERLWSAYVTATEATVLTVDDLVQIKDLTARYFSSSPPFSGTGKKKAEFPDAMALLSLESWAKSQNTKILAISRDDDWRSFAAQSDHIVCLSDVPEALDHFNRESRFVADRTLALLQSQNMSDVSNEIANAVERFFDDDTTVIEATSSSYDYVGTLQGGALQYWTLKSGPLVLTADDDKITFVVDLNCKVSFRASFSWSIYSDHEWHTVGDSTTHTTEQDRVLQFTITCSRVIKDEREVYDVEVTSRPVEIDFGFVEPGWDYEE